MSAITSSSPITQVSQTAPMPSHALQPHLLTRLHLDLRGSRFEVDRDTIMNLPESVLLLLFPNGLVLSRQSVIMDGAESEEEDQEVYVVDFDPQCFHYVLSFFRQAQDAFYGTASSPGLYQAQHQALLDPSSVVGTDYPHSQNPLLTKQAIIVLKEELEYFCIPPKAVDGSPLKFTDDQGIGNDAHLKLKRECGNRLLEKRSIFTALQRNVNKENNAAEQHLIDMLCMSGFNREDTWGYRAVEPSRACISSVALVLLKTGISHANPSEPTAAGVTVDHAQMGTAQKLLLFWRKPARKCWWDGVDLNVAPDGEEVKIVKLWARRVWTLELSLL